jgi:hypothetical protein
MRTWQLTIRISSPAPTSLDFELTMKLDEKLRLAPVLGTISTAAEDEYH